MRSNNTVVKDFKEGNYTKSGNVFAEKINCNIAKLYSYGHHFVLATKRDVGACDEWHLLNADKYSVTTSVHQSCVGRYFRNDPRVSYGTLHLAGLDEERVELVDFEKDFFESGDDLERLKKISPEAATISKRTTRDGSEYWESHLVGTCVLEQDGSHYLCSMDERQYFIAKLPHKVKNVTEAFRSLKPEEVKQAETEGKEVLRQGEWFFIPVGPVSELCGKDKTFPYLKKEIDRQFRLPNKSAESTNFHAVTRGFIHENKLFCFGIVRHQTERTWSPYTLVTHIAGTREHRNLKLKDGILYQAVLNTSVADWTSGVMGIGID